MISYVRAWHFVSDRLRDGRAIPPDGVWLEQRVLQSWLEHRRIG